MAGQSLARLLAPLALVAFAVALYLVVTGSSRDRAAATGTQTEERRSATSGSSRRESSAASRRSASRRPRSYVVKAGDTPGAIAEATNVPLSQIERLNPELDPQTLAPGTRIRLRP